jgi:hypothetical protein
MEMIAQTRTGRFVAFGQPDGIHVVDTLGPAPRRVIAREARSLAWVRDELWIAGTDDAIWRVRGRFAARPPA